MSGTTITINAEQYLKQWYIDHRGGEHPVTLKKGSPESFFLEFALQHKKNSKPAPPPPDGTEPLTITIPEFRHKPSQYYNYLSETSQTALLKILRRRFDYELWTDISPIQELIVRQDEILYAWMESHGIEPTEKNWNAIAKRLQRMRHRLRCRERMRKVRKNTEKND